MVGLSYQDLLGFIITNVFIKIAELFVIQACNFGGGGGEEGYEGPYPSLFRKKCHFMKIKIICPNMNDVCRFSRDHVVECSKEQFYLVLNQFVYIGDVSIYMSFHIKILNSSK